jgi:hypothetical protein
MAESGSHPSSISGSREWLPARSFAPLLTSRSWFFQSQEVSSQFGGYWFRRTEGRALVRSQSVCSRVQLGANVSQQARGFILSICSCLWAMLALAGPVYSEDAPAKTLPISSHPLRPLRLLTLKASRSRSSWSPRCWCKERASRSRNTGYGLEHHNGARRKNRLDVPADHSLPGW